ncbi:hypothetical protein U1Q18_014947 [Sarracenia purpurea var. burkii]
MGGKDGVVVETGGGQRSIDRNCPVSLVRSEGKASAEFEGGNFQRKSLGTSTKSFKKDPAVAVGGSETPVCIGETRMRRRAKGKDNFSRSRITFVQ